MAPLLAPEAILGLLLKLLPRSTSSPLPRPTDAIAALAHAIHTALDFRLVDSPQGQPIAEQSLAAQAAASVDFDDGASEATAVEPEGEADAQPVEGRLPQGWNSRGEDSYVFQYRHAQSSMTFRVRVGRMGGRVQLDAMAEDGAPSTISVILGDLLTPPAFPIPSRATASSSSSSSPEAPARSLGFKSLAAVKQFVDQYAKDIIAKILPGLQKEGYNEPASSGSDPRNPPPAQPARASPPANPSPLVDPLRSGPQRMPYHPASVGHRDLDPFASQQTPGAFNPQGDGGGMYVDFNHPLFDGRRRGQDPDMTGPGGLINPPGARWDPVGPGMGGTGGFPGAGRNPLGGVGQGDPDWDEMPPPGQLGPDLGRLGGPGMGPGRGRGAGGGGLGGGFGRLGPGGGGGGGMGGFGGGMYM